ncbi:2376_t:CDS:2, partial [Racocetra fulgida]
QAGPQFLQVRGQHLQQFGLNVGSKGMIKIRGPKERKLFVTCAKEKDISLMSVILGNIWGFSFKMIEPSLETVDYAGGCDKEGFSRIQIGLSPRERVLRPDSDYKILQNDNSHFKQCDSGIRGKDRFNSSYIEKSIKSIYILQVLWHQLQEKQDPLPVVVIEKYIDFPHPVLVGCYGYKI